MRFDPGIMRPLHVILLLAGAGCFFFMPFLGGVRLFDWDEINFAEISREMVVLGDYLRIHINYEPFWEKPPLFFWLQAACMHVFGIGEYAARFPNAVCGVLTLIILFLIGSKLYDKRFGVLWALAYLGSLLPHLYFRSGIIDPWFNLFIFCGIYLFILYTWKRSQILSHVPHNLYLYLIGGGVILGLAILTKGPVAYLIFLLCCLVMWIANRFRLFVTIPHFMLFSIAAAILTLAWYGVETWKNGSWFVREFIEYQYRLLSTPDAGHKGFPGYHLVVLLIGCFPASLFAIRGFFRLHQSEGHQVDFRRWMIILFWVVVILFSVVESKIVHYSSLAYFPLTYLAVLVIYQMLKGRMAIPRWLPWSLACVGGIYVLVTIAAPFVAMNKDMLIPLIDDPFARANLEADVRWTGAEVIPGIWLLSVLILSMYFMRRGQIWHSVFTLFLGVAVFITLLLAFFIARIEGYSQAAAMRFFESLRGQDCYVSTVNYKSYGQLFYFRKPPGGHPQSSDRDWLMHSPDIDKDVYLITKIHQTENVEALPDFVKIGEENGFVFWKREVQQR